MTHCPNCGKEISEEEIDCPRCGRIISDKRAETVREIERYKQKQKNSIATFLIGIICMWLIPFYTLTLVLAVTSLGIAPLLILYYTWKKRKAERRLEDPVSY